MKVLLATNNQHKVGEIKEILRDCRDALVDLSRFKKFPEPVEDGESYYDNALIKACHYYQLTGIPTIADDSGIEIDAFGGEPGIYSSRFIDPNLSFAERNRIVLERLRGVPEEKRGARFRCCCVMVRNSDEIIVEYGTLEGRIGHEIRGTHGFGYDPIFFLPDRGISLAEVSPDEKNHISHRAQAFMKMEKHLMEMGSVCSQPGPWMM